MNGDNIDLRVWRQFAVLAQELHFGRAAQRLHMSQPPLSQAIARLEAALGVRLFDRSRRRVELTPAAAALLPDVQALLVRAAALPLQARASAAGERGRLRLAFVSTAGYTFLPRWVRAFRDREPGVKLELLEATSDLQLDALARAELDAGLVWHAPGMASGINAHLLVAREPMVLALPEQHPLAARPENPSLKDVLGEPLVLFPRRIAPSLHDAIVTRYHLAGSAPVVAQEAIQMQTIVNLVSAGLGLAWVGHSVTAFQRAGVVYRELRDANLADAVWCETSLLWSVDNPNPALARFLAFAHEQAQSRPC